MSYELVVWLEIHLKIKSPNKLFCKCENTQKFDTILPNTNICPVCSAQPWALPVLNEEPLWQSIKLWKALNCTVNKNSTFDRKSYFYPDQPSGYQITQLYHPTNTNGQVSFFVDKEYSKPRTVGIRDAHIETDTWKTIHLEWQALLDFNRAGTPLVEIVTEPDFRSSEEVVEFLKELQRIVRYNDISDADLEKWQMRVDVNISVRPEWVEEFGTRVELKNINSFGAIRRAIANEYQRQTEALQNWEQLSQDTRRRDDLNWESFVMRSKENTLDYRYFPEPDLPLLQISDEMFAKLEKVKIEKPFEIIKKMKTDWNFHKEYINTIIWDKKVLDYFFELAWNKKENLGNTNNASFGKKVPKAEDLKNTKSDVFPPKLVAKRISGQISFWMKENYKTIEELPFDKQQFIDFLYIANQNKIQSNQLKIVMDEMLQTWKNAKDIISEKWFNTDNIDNSELEKIASNILEENKSIVEQYKWWKVSTIWFFVWQMMKKTQWKANPQTAKTIFEKLLG